MIEHLAVGDPCWVGGGNDFFGVGEGIVGRALLFPFPMHAPPGFSVCIVCKRGNYSV